MTERYDYIICGAGLAGLSLAIRMATSQFEDKRILLLDKSRKDTNDRTWSFWTTGEQDRFASLYRKSWTKLAFHAPGNTVIDEPQPYSYHTISGIDFYRHCFKILDDCPHISFKQDDILEIRDCGAYGTVVTASAQYEGAYIFDSVVRNFPEDHHLFVWQHFLGWEVKLKEGRFDADTATFMDFRIEQEGDTRFVYVLPFTDQTALVEATIFSRDIMGEKDYEVILEEYMDQYVSTKYEVVHKELGAIPMTTAPFGKSTERVICIGTNNATVKPSSGYAFTRIQRECDRLVQRIEAGQPGVIRSSAKYLAYDRTLLNVLLSGKESGRKVFDLLFRHNKMGQILKFLDEETSLTEEIRIFNTLPFWSFLRAFMEENVVKYKK